MARPSLPSLQIHQQSARTQNFLAPSRPCAAWALDPPALEPPRTFPERRPPPQRISRFCSSSNSFHSRGNHPAQKTSPIAPAAPRAATHLRQPTHLPEPLPPLALHPPDSPSSPAPRASSICEPLIPSHPATCSRRKAPEQNRRQNPPPSPQYRPPPRYHLSQDSPCSPHSASRPHARAKNSTTRPQPTRLPPPPVPSTPPTANALAAPAPSSCGARETLPRAALPSASALPSARTPPQNASAPAPALALPPNTPRTLRTSPRGNAPSPSSLRPASPANHRGPVRAQSSRTPCSSSLLHPLASLTTQ